MRATVAAQATEMQQQEELLFTNSVRNAMSLLVSQGQGNTSSDVGRLP